MAHLFGPVPSRRLGRSLGVDLIPPKTCPLNCIYCEVGPTTHQTRERRGYHGESIIHELKDYLDRIPQMPDCITLAGSGEPTLNRSLGHIIQEIKGMTATPVAVLTNGALLDIPEVRRELAAADVVLPSLDAAREETFRKINRPLPGFTLAQLLGGLKAFRREYTGRIWLEIMLLKGLNDSEEELAGLRRAIAATAPDKVQLNTAVRPVVEEYARALSRAEMEAAASFLGGEVEVIASFDRAPIATADVSDAVFLESLSRRPMTAPDLARALGLTVRQVKVRLQRLCAIGFVARVLYQDLEFYRSQENTAAYSQDDCAGSLPLRCKGQIP